MNIVDFIEARIAEDEQAAKDATEAPWNLRVHESDDKIVTESGHTLIYGASYEEVVLEVDENDLLHVSRHDPARVLRQCKTLRTLARPHKSDDMFDPDEGLPNLCTQCREPWPCEDIGLIASIWSDHPDYDTTWS